MSKRLSNVALILNERKIAKQNYTVFGSKADEIKKAINIQYGEQAGHIRFDISKLSPDELDEIRSINTRLNSYQDMILSQSISEESLEDYTKLQHRRLDILEAALIS